MPLKDKEARLAYQRKWYAENSARVIAKVKARKWGEYAGVCENCGGPTMGNTKGKAARFCSKPDCASVQRRGRIPIARMGTPAEQRKALVESFRAKQRQQRRRKGAKA